MFRSSFVMLAIVLLVVVSSLDGKTTNGRRRNSTATRKPVTVKICGVALVRMLDLVCTRARELVMSNETPSASPGKRQLLVDDDPFSRTLSITDYAQFNNTLIGDCCLQACSLKTLLKYC